MVFLIYFSNLAAELLAQLYFIFLTLMKSRDIIFIENEKGDIIMNYRVNGVFSDFQLLLNQDFGVPYGTGAIEYKSSDILVEDPWVICPNCDEPIYMSDCIGDGKNYWDCPSCCCIEEGELE